MAFAFKPPVAPMEAVAVGELPTGENWQYEPKWDGFRCLAFRDGDAVYLQSKAGKPFSRYFPEVEANLRALPSRRFTLDGEIIIPTAAGLSFDDLLQRIHPAASRVERLARETPAKYVLFDLLSNERGRRIDQRPLDERRRLLEAFAERRLRGAPGLALSPATTRLATARRWLKGAGGTLDGVIAKRLDLPYRSGERDGMVKIKPRHTVDCVVGGFRYASKGTQVGSLLLGLYDAEGLLQHVGFTSAIPREDRPALTRRLEKLAGGPGFTGRAPGGPSRWSTARSTQWEPVKPKLVVEVEYDHLTADRFRHGTRLVRWRPDKAPRQCTFEQVRTEGAKLARLLGEPSRRRRTR